MTGPEAYQLRALPATTSIFFFQAEDGIRDPLVTGVQTCALPILTTTGVVLVRTGSAYRVHTDRGEVTAVRSEERRVGKECRHRWLLEDTIQSQWERGTVSR